MKRVTLIISALALAIPATARAGANYLNKTWSGYYVLAKPGYAALVYRTGFNVPEADCAKTKGLDGENMTGIWAGVDGVGFGQGYVEQGGIYMYCDKESRPHYGSFWEMYRDESPTPPSAYANDWPKVFPGDYVDVSVEPYGTTETYIEVTDQIRKCLIGNGQYCDVRWTRTHISTLNPKAPHASAETIIEREPSHKYLTAYFGLVKTESSNYTDPRRQPTCELCNPISDFAPYGVDTPWSTSHKAYFQNATPDRVTNGAPGTTAAGASYFSEGIPHS